MANEEAKKTIETEEKTDHKTKQEAKSEALGMRMIMQAQALERGVKPVDEDERYREVIGIQSIKKKDGSGYAFRLYFTEPYTTYDLQNGQCIGVRVSDEYIRDTSLIPPDLKIGDRVKVYKEQRGTFLSVVEIRIV
ncbi:MAG: hypothetical protein K2I07_00135 [Lachnospiraceae bacterium]|nr:hypothetical protein [Lachnospiraceae bacterium]